MFWECEFPITSCFESGHQPCTYVNPCSYCRRHYCCGQRRVDVGGEYLLSHSLLPWPAFPWQSLGCLDSDRAEAEWWKGVAAFHCNRVQIFGVGLLDVWTNHNVCMYVCMYACMYVCMYVSMYVSMYVCMYWKIHSSFPLLNAVLNTRGCVVSLAVVSGHCCLEPNVVKRLDVGVQVCWSTVHILGY